jgi:hypothetical protein
MNPQSLLLLILGAFTVGLIEWWTATKRMLAIERRNRFLVSLFVFLEVSIALGISLVAIKEFSTFQAFVIFEIYALGGAIGSAIPLKRKVKS